MQADAKILPMSARNPPKEEEADEHSKKWTVVVPGEIVSSEPGLLRGHGILSREDTMQASLPGAVQQLNKLLRVRPVKSRYQAEVGDVVVGRIREVGERRWKVDINHKLEASLLLSAISLPSGEQRRRNASDELQMRSFFVEGDLISAEVQSVQGDGSVMLQTRSLKYGRLTEGGLVVVRSELVRRSRNHMVDLEDLECHLVVGVNGGVWVSGPRLPAARLRAAAQALNAARLPIQPSTIYNTYLVSIQKSVAITDMLLPALLPSITGHASASAQDRN